MHEGKEKEKEREKKEKKKKKSKGDILSHFELIRYGWKKGEFSIQILGLFNPALSLFNYLQNCSLIVENFNLNRK